MNQTLKGNYLVSNSNSKSGSSLKPSLSKNKFASSDPKPASDTGSSISKGLISALFSWFIYSINFWILPINTIYNAKVQRIY